MQTRARRTATLVVSLFAVMLMTATAASAQYVTGPDFGVSCTPGSPDAGDATSCSVVGAESGEVLSASAAFGSETFFEEDLTADADGEANFAFTVPAEAEGQEVTVTVSGAQSGTVQDEVDVEDDADADGDDAAGAPVDGTDDSLPLTGVEVGSLAAIGIALLAAGLLALRRREDAKVSATV